MAGKIRKDMTFEEILSKHPEAGEMMLRRGLHCVGCGIAAYETVEQGAAAHGMNGKQIDSMVEEINKKIKGGSRK